MQVGNFTFSRQNSRSRANWPACSCELSTRGARCVPTGHECVRPLAAGGCYFAAGNTAISESSRSLSNHSNRSNPKPNRGIRNRRAVAHRSSSSVPDLDFHANNAITRRGIMLDCRADCSLSLSLLSRRVTRGYYTYRLRRQLRRRAFLLWLKFLASTSGRNDGISIEREYEIFARRKVQFNC